MRVAIISDIHGNLVSLEAVLHALDEEEVDEVVCLGDIAATGPQPRQVIERFRSRGIPVILGNADAWLLNPIPLGEVDENAQRIVELNLWCRKQLTATQSDYLRSLPATQQINLGNGVNMFCCHGSPHSYMDRILATTTIDDLQTLLSGVTAEIVACGHTHIQLLRRYMNQVIINPGSVGMSYDVIPNPPDTSSEGARIRNPPWAEYAIVKSTDRGLEFSLMRTSVDRDKVIQAAFDSGMPNPEWWTSDWRQPTREE